MPSDSEAEDAPCDEAEDPGEDLGELQGPHPEDRPDDAAIGQQRTDTAPIRSVDESEPWTQGCTPNIKTCKSVACELTDELINVNYALQFSMLPICETLTYQDLTWQQWLRGFASRARNIANGVGTITSVWWEDPGTPFPGETRRYSGARGSKELHAKLPGAEKNCLQAFAGLSPFALPKVLRSVLRMGIGYVEFDQELSHIQAAIQLHDIEAAPLTHEYYSN